MAELTTILSVVVLVAVSSLALAIYVLAVSLRQVLAKNCGLATQILVLKAHEQGGPMAAAQILRSQKLSGLAAKEKSEKPPRPKEKPPEPFTVKSSFS